MTMRQVGLVVGVPAATVSQMEKGVRAFKNESWIEPWARAIKTKPWVFRTMKEKFDKVPVGPVVRRTSRTLTKTTLELLICELTGPERSRVQGYIDAIIESR